MNSAEEPHGQEVYNVEPGMLVEATGGDLGARDLTAPTVSKVVQDDTGEIAAFVVEKGIVFKKQIEVPSERIQQVEPPDEEGGSPGKVTIQAAAEEVQALGPTGAEPLRRTEVTEAQPEKGQLLDTEASQQASDKEMAPVETHRMRLSPPGVTASQMAGNPARQVGDEKGFSLRDLGPGFLAGMSGKDSSADATYAVNGAQFGYGQLWLMLLTTPLLQAVQFACAKVGRIQQKGFAEVVRDRYGKGVAGTASGILVIANIALVAANLVAIGSGMELITGVSWYWFVAPAALLLWYLTVYKDFGTIKRIFVPLSFVYLVYIVTALFSKADWGAVLLNTFVPNLDLSLPGISAAVALMGATLSPYSFFWQVQGEKEETRAGSLNAQLRTAGLDIFMGVAASNVVAYFIIVTSAATLHAHGQKINTAADAARALEPLLGSFAKYLFAVGFVSAALIAIPILLASTSSAVADTVGWPASLSGKPWQCEGFYLIFTAALAASIVVALIGVDPIQLMFWANVVQGIFAPVLLALLLWLGNDRKAMRGRPFNRWTNMGLVATTLLMTSGAALLIYGLLAGT